MFPALALGVGVAGAAASWWNRRDQADLQRAETREAVRRFERDAARTVGLARARGAASGVEFESRSLQDHLSAMTEEFRRQAQWMRESGYRGAATTDRAAGFGLVADLGSSLIGFGNANNWWRRPPGSAA
jgi:hypothetical protein